MQGFWGCDYSKTVEIQKGVQIFVLSSFPTEACWGTMNAVFSILSLILVLIQVVITMGTVMIFCDTFITSKAKFLLLDPFLISYVIGSNQLYLIISIVTPKFVSFLRPIYFAIFSLGFVILLFRNLPFVRRRANSVYGGVGFARIGVAVASLIASLVNASDSWDLGLGLAFCPPVLALIGFVIGFLVTDFYTKYLFNRGHEMVKLALTHDTRIHNRDFKAVCAFLQFSMKGINEHKRLVSDFIETSQHADWLDAHMKVLFSLFLKDVSHSPHYFISLQLLKRAEKQPSSSIFMKYNIFIRTRETEKCLSNGRLNSAHSEIILEGVKIKMRKLRYLIIQFWKNLLASMDVNDLIQNIQSLTSDCDIAFNNLILENEDDPFFQKLYTEYQEELSFNVLDTGNGSKEIPNTTKETENNDQLLDVPMMDDNLDSVSQVAEETVDKQQEIVSNAINKREVNRLLFYFLVTFGIVSTGFIIVLLSVTLPLLSYFTNLDVLTTTVPLPSLPYFTVVNIESRNILKASDSVSYLRALNFELEQVENVELLFDSGIYDQEIMALFNSNDKKFIVSTTIIFRGNYVNNCI